METDEVRYALRDFAIELSSALSEAEAAASSRRSESAAALIGALGKAKHAADKLVNDLETT
jgi:hypothetical protein